MEAKRVRRSCFKRSGHAPLAPPGRAKEAPAASWPVRIETAPEPWTEIRRTITDASRGIRATMNSAVLSQRRGFSGQGLRRNQFVLARRLENREHKPCVVSPPDHLRARPSSPRSPSARCPPRRRASGVRGIADDGVAGDRDGRAAARPRQRRTGARRVQPGDHEQLHRRGDAHLPGCERRREGAPHAQRRGTGRVHPPDRHRPADDEHPVVLHRRDAGRRRTAVLRRPNRAETAQQPNRLHLPARVTPRSDHRHRDRPRTDPPRRSASADRDRPTASRRGLGLRQRVL